MSYEFLICVSTWIHRSRQSLVAGYIFPGSENPLLETKTIKTTVTCDFKLRWYPWDDQLCFLTLVVCTKLFLELFLVSELSSPYISMVNRS